LRFFIISYNNFIRVNLPPEAHPATVLEMDETDIAGKYSESNVSDIYVDCSKYIKKKSKESLSPLAKSEDLVDEELANMEHAESLDILSTNVCNNIRL
jgi:hypothetical protein